MTVSFPCEEFYPEVEADMPDDMTLHAYDSGPHHVCSWCYKAHTDDQVDGPQFTSKDRAIKHARVWAKQKRGQ